MCRLQAFCFWLALVLITGSRLAGATGLPIELQRCREEKDEVKRLECFDRESARLANPEIVKGRVAEPAPLTPEQRFGFRGDIARATIDDKRRAEPVLEKLQAKVTAVRFTPTGYWIVTLDNEQEWEQVPLGVRVSIKPGDSVSIMPLSLGSFALVAQSGQSTRVRRRR